MQPGKAPSNPPYSMDEVNAWDQSTFVRILGPTFEHSPWIAERTWRRRPFASLSALHDAMTNTVTASTEKEKLDLIRAHPDLVGRAAPAGAITASSTREQASAGLDRLTPDEIAAFQRYNQAYRERFGFPFVICARLNKKEAILAGFRSRLDHSQAEEIKAALGEISKIAFLRLCDLVENQTGGAVAPNP